MRIVAGGLLVMLTVAGLAACGQPPASVPVIGYVQYVEAPQLADGLAGFTRALSDAGLRDGQDFVIDYRCAQGEMANIPLILSTFADRRVAMVATSTNPCMLAAAQRVRDVPVVVTVTLDPAICGVTVIPPNMTGTYKPFQADTFVQVLRACHPSATVIGLPYSPHEAHAEYAAGAIRDAAAAQGIRTILQPVSAVSDLPEVARALAAQGAQAFVVASDNTIYTGLETIVAVAREKKIPLFVTDAGLNARGAAVGWGLNYHDWGYASGQVAAELLRGKTVAEVPLRSNDRFRIDISDTECAAQGLRLCIPVSGVRAPARGALTATAARSVSALSARPPSPPR